MSDELVFTVDQVAEASTALRTAAGLPPEHVPLERFLQMLGNEIGALRATGWGDVEIAALISESTGSTVTVEALASAA